MKKRNYLTPTMRLHNLKSGRIMAASGASTESYGNEVPQSGFDDGTDVE